MTAEAILDRLDGVRKTGAARWVARCPAHADRGPSLSIRELDDGRVLLHDFAGCDVGAIVAAIGLELSDLFPPRVADDRRTPRERQPFDARDALRLIDSEVDTAARLVIVSTHIELTAAQRADLVRAARSIRAARVACGLREARG